MAQRCSAKTLLRRLPRFAPFDHQSSLKRLILSKLPHIILGVFAWFFFATGVCRGEELQTLQPRTRHDPVQDAFLHPRLLLVGQRGMSVSPRGVLRHHPQPGHLHGRGLYGPSATSAARSKRKTWSNSLAVFIPSLNSCWIKVSPACSRPFCRSYTAS